MFRMTVEDVFFITGRGLVATGKIEEGVLRVGDEVQINSGPAVRVEGIEVFRKVLEQAQAGDNVGILLKGLDKGAVKAGDVLTCGAVAPSFTPSAPSPDISESQDAANRALGRD